LIASNDDNTGKELGQLPEIGYGGPQFLPNGRFLAAHADDEHNGKHFIRLYDHLSSRSFASQRRIACSSAAGVIGFSAKMGAGSFSKIADATLS
jgi:hypothetical protein